MEHRNGTRIPTHLSVTLYSGNRNLGWHQTLNLGNGGMAIRGRIAGLEKNALVTVQLELEEEEVTLRALVVYRHAKATGLMWASSLPDRVALQNLPVIAYSPPVDRLADSPTKLLLLQN